MSIPNTPVLTANSHSAALKAAPQKPAQQGDDFSFWDLLDVINPLQHIPVVSQVYRQITGDEIKGFARIAGGAVFGGVLGIASGVANTVYAQKHNGQDFGDVALAKLQGKAIEVEKPLEVAVKPVPPAQRFPDVAIEDTAKKETPAKETPEAMGAKLAEKIAIAPLPEKQQAHVMPPALTLAALDDTPEEEANENSADISAAMMQALAKYNKMQTATEN